MSRWEPDSASKKCYLCKSAFTLLYRRHHCRNCGQLVCVNCASQSVSYLNDAKIANPSNTPEIAKPGEVYRTCDTCCDEIVSVRRRLVAEPDPTQETDVMVTAPAISVNPAKKTLRTSSRRTVNDADMCPVCGTNLLEQFSALEVSSPEGLEPFKEAHVSECLTTHDFANDNLRLSSPPNGSHARNRMLVYNMPPIPEPSYESIKDSSPSSAGALSNTSTSVEKEPVDVECVICLEDLSPGDKVGRLECLCVFHYKCIKGWFNKKSFAECPVHFLHS